MSVELFLAMFKTLLSSSKDTVLLFSGTLLFALPLGLILSFGRMSSFKPLQWIVRFYLLIMRGTPLMLQLFFFWYGLPLSNIGISRMGTAMIAFFLNYAAYFAEIYRAGIQGIPHGQREAANVLGFSKNQTFFRVILPQVVKRILPPMGNEFMTLVKDTSLARAIGVLELTDMSIKLQNTYISLVPLLIAGVFYLIMNSRVSKGFNSAEKKLSYYK